MELIRVLRSKCLVKVLKEIAIDLGQSVLGNKRTLFNSLQDCPNATKVNNNTLEYQTWIVVGEDAKRPAIPTWVILAPEDMLNVEGINMATGVEEGFFAPTNKENSVGKSGRTSSRPRTLLVLSLAQGRMGARGRWTMRCPPPSGL